LPFAIQTANKAGQIYPIAIQNPAIWRKIKIFQFNSQK
jgi:hypothetical protein